MRLRADVPHAKPHCEGQAYWARSAASALLSARGHNHISKGKAKNRMQRMGKGRATDSTIMAEFHNSNGVGPNSSTHKMSPPQNT
jgi:hypothetical protein